jgi:hypothetical protein
VAGRHRVEVPPVRQLSNHAPDVIVGAFDRR